MDPPDYQTPRDKAFLYMRKAASLSPRENKSPRAGQLIIIPGDLALLYMLPAAAWRKSLDRILCLAAVADTARRAPPPAPQRTR
jgi:hypothetical protein